MRIWLVESREESNFNTEARRGPWYPCGYEVHRKKKDAEVEIAKLGGRGPYRATEYIPRWAEGEAFPRVGTITGRISTKTKNISNRPKAARERDRQ